MSITVDVGLLSGKTVAVKAGLDDKVETLKLQAQTALGVGRGRLLNSSGVVLDACSKIKDAGLQNCDSLTLHIKKDQVQATRIRSAFAAILGGTDASRAGDLLKLVATVVLSRISCVTCSKSKPLRALSLPFLAMDPS